MSKRRYAEEFKTQAIKQIVEGGRSVMEVAKEFGVSYKSLYLWLRDWHSLQVGRSEFDAQAIQNEMASIEIKLWSLEKQLNALLNPTSVTSPYKLDISSIDDGPEVLSHYLTYVRDKKTGTLEPRGVLVLKLPEKFHRREKKLARAK